MTISVFWPAPSPPSQAIMWHYQPVQGCNNVLAVRKIITIIITMIFLTIMSFMNPDQLLKSGEEYLDYLEGGWSGQNLLLVVCWRKPSLKPEKEYYREVEEVFKYKYNRI